MALLSKLNFHSRTAKILLGVLLVLVILRAALPIFLKNVVNEKLAHLKGYRGHVEDIDVSLLRGAYRLEGLRIVKTGGRIPVPFFSARSIDISVEWKALFRGRIVSEIETLSPELNFVDGPTAQQSQKKIDSSWIDAAAELVPIELNRVAIRNGEVHFRNLHSRPPVDLKLSRISAVATNLSNARNARKALPSSLRLEASAMGTAPLKLDLRLNAMKEPMDFDLNGELKDLSLPKLNAFFRAYAAIDVNRGTLDLSTELAAKDGALKGYVKPILKDLNVVEAKDVKKGPFSYIWQSISGTVADLVQKNDRQAMKIPIEGTLKAPKTNAMAAVGSALGHAFGKPLHEGVEGTINANSPKQGEETKKAE